MASKPIAKRTIPCPLGTCHEDQWCAHTVQAPLAANGNGVPAVQVGLIEVGSNSDGEELLLQPPGIVVRWQIGEEELTLQHEVALEKQDNPCISSQTGCCDVCPFGLTYQQLAMPWASQLGCNWQMNNLCTFKCCIAILL